MIAPTAAALGDDVVVDPVSWMTAPGPWSVPDVAAGVARRVEAAGRGPVLRRSFAAPPPHDVTDELRRYAAAVPRQAALDVLRSQRDLDLTDRLAAITCWAAVVHGVHDRPRSADDARAVAAALGGAALHWADCGHTPVFEAPGVVAGAVRDLLRRL